MQKDSTKLYTPCLISMLAVIAVCFTGICNRDLWRPDEPRVAAISLEMAQDGNFIIPHLAGEPFVEKPPLYFAASAYMLKAMGAITGKTTAIRFTTVLFGLGVLLMTFLIARIFGGFEAGILAMIILATMEGFVKNFHWIRVDAALAFFVIASIWCFTKVYYEDKLEFCPLAGLFLAGSFLSKGLIGPVFVAVPWSGLFIIRLFQHKNNKINIKRFVFYHLVSLLIFFGISGLWMLLLYNKGGKSIWDEWFWVNQVGRLSGTAHKGHIKPGRPFYYIMKVMEYGMPWTPLIIFWAGSRTVDFIKNRSLSWKNLFLCIWAIGSILFLTISATKRGMYLFPALPVFAIMAAASLKPKIPEWFKKYSDFWILISFIIITGITFFPFLAIFLTDTLSVYINEFIRTFGYYNFFSSTGLIISLIFVFRYRKKFTPEYLMVIMTSLLYVSILGYPIQIINGIKSMESDTRNFVSAIPEPGRAKIAGCLSETLSGCFYYYSDWKVPQIKNTKKINDILSGQDNRYNSIIKDCRINNKKAFGTGLFESPYHIISETMIGHKRKLFWVEGLRPE